MSSFQGFPAKPDYVAIPKVFFSDLLPAIQDAAELHVTLHLFRLLSAKRGYPRSVSAQELQQDRALVAALGRSEPGGDAQAAITRGLAAAIERGTFLSAASGEGAQILLLNTEKDRRAAEAIQQGRLTAGASKKGPARPLPVALPERDIFSLYEECIGTLSPLIVDRLQEAEQEYPAAWVQEAFQIAVEQNKRSWRYVERILERWQSEGKDDGTVGRRSQTERVDYTDWLPARRREQP